MVVGENTNVLEVDEHLIREAMRCMRDFTSNRTHHCVQPILCWPGRRTRTGRRRRRTWRRTSTTRPGVLDGGSGGRGTRGEGERETFFPLASFCCGGEQREKNEKPPPRLGAFLLVFPFTSYEFSLDVVFCSVCSQRGEKKAKRGPQRSLTDASNIS